LAIKGGYTGWLLISLIACGLLDAKEPEHHLHEGDNIKIDYDRLNFHNSLKKEDGARYGVEFDHLSHGHHLQLYYEHTDTATTALLPKDLSVDKYTLKYRYKTATKEHLMMLFSTIDDNLMKETDGGKIYGVGYGYHAVEASGYLSDYPHFNVYQGDLKYKHLWQGIEGTLIGKYIHLQDKNSNSFSQKAQSDYFTVGLRLHTHYRGWHLMGSGYLGKRMFAVMKDGFKVQHHAMEFKESYILGIGHNLHKDLSVHLRYGYHTAKEVPSDHDNVHLETLSINGIFRF